MDPGSETVLFLHIPKAAGTTLDRIAERHYPASQRYRLGAHAQAGIEAFNNLTSAERSRFRYLAGHFPFGVHEQVPGDWAYLTFLREPLDRVASFYYFVRNDPGHYLTQAMMPRHKTSLRAFLEESRVPMLDNGQTRQLAGDWGEIPFGECDESLLEKAKSNLDRIAVVGLSEFFIPSLLLAADRFGWTRLGYHAQNQTRNRPPKETLDDPTRETLQKLNTLDQELYAYAKQRFEQDCQKEGDDFNQRASTFSTDHPSPSALQHTLDRIRSRTPKQWIQHVLRKKSG
jgi:hypothetical protein